PRVVCHDVFWAYVDGRMVYRGEGTRQTGCVSTIPLPRSVVDSGQATIVIKATLGPADTGIQHHGAFLVGPAQALNSLDVAMERKMVTFFLLFLLTKGSILFVFAIIYLAAERSRELAAFLAFGICSTLGHLFASEMLATYIPFTWQAFLFFSVR